MIILYIISLTVIICALSQNLDCESGAWDSFNNTCMFYCYDTQNYVPISSLSFNFIRSLCPDIQAAYENGICDSTDDIVIPAGNLFCGCPYCKCSSISSELKETFTNEPSKECNNCTCSSAPSYTEITDIVYQCDRLMTVNYEYNPWNWDLYSCPPNECTDIKYSGYEQTYHTGDYWTADTGNSNETCDEFCYCPASGDAICGSGYEDILSIDSGLKNAFMEDSACGYRSKACYDMDSQSYDVDRLFTTSTGPSCGWLWKDCPYCECPDGKLENDTWYHESQSLLDIEDNMATCNLCTCKKDDMGNLYADCGWNSFGKYTVGEGECPPSEVYTCHSGFSSISPEASGSINPTECANDLVTLNNNYCQLNYGGGPLMNIKGRYSWGCGNSLICEAFADNTCVYANTSYTYTDCYDIEHTEILTGYTKCCDASSNNNCNYYESISLDECTRSTAYEDFWVSIEKCFGYPADECIDEVDEITCDGIIEFYESRWSCRCGAFAVIYANVGTESQALLQTGMDEDLSTEFEGWNDELGCDIQITCDLSTGLINSDSTQIFNVFVSIIIGLVIVSTI